MNPGGPLESLELAKAGEAKLPTPTYEKEIQLGDEKLEHPATAAEVNGHVEPAHDPDAPTEEELHSLPRVSGKLPWQAYTIAFVELCERFSYYGTTVVFTNFIQRPLPEGSKTGAAKNTAHVSGALGLGQRASTGLTTFNGFWVYCMPILGAYIADEYIGRFKTIQLAILFAVIGHTIIIISAIPPVIVHPHGAIGCFAIGLIVMGVGVGMFKSNISPLIAEQYKDVKMRVITKKGVRSIMDPTITIQRIYLYFYMMINVGSIIGQVSMVYAEKWVGFWCSFSLPTFMFLLCPMVLFACRKRYTHTLPAGSVLGNAVKLWSLAMKGKWSANPITTVKQARADGFWDNVKPSRLGPNKPAWMTFDDQWVDQVRRGLKACTVFLWMPVYWLTYNQMNNNLVSQAATMDLNGIPNDLLNNLNPLAIIIFIPIVDFGLYPSLRKLGLHFTPIKRMFVGFMFGSLAMMVAAITQHYIYHTNPCGYHANDCLNNNNEFSPINVWVQTPSYVLIGLSEIFLNITSLEYAFTKAPKNMRSLIMSANLFMSALGNAITYALLPLSDDPLLVWNYGAAGVAAFIAGICFWFTHNHLDAQEDRLNMLPDTAYFGKSKVPHDAELAEPAGHTETVTHEETKA